MSAKNLERLVRRHHRELTTYGPVLRGVAAVDPESGDEARPFYLLDKHVTVLRMVAETEAGRDERAFIISAMEAFTNGVALAEFEDAASRVVER